MKGVAVILNSSEIQDLMGFKADFGVDEYNRIHLKVNLRKRKPAQVR